MTDDNVGLIILLWFAFLYSVATATMYLCEGLLIEYRKWRALRKAKRLMKRIQDTLGEKKDD
jgi:hypothetical protein